MRRALNGFFAMYALLPVIIRGYVKSYSGLSKACWSRIAVNFISATAAGMYFFLSYYFVRALHIDIAIAGMLIAVYGFGRAIGGMIGGKLSDHISPEIVSVVSVFIEGLGFFTLPQLHLTAFLAMNVFLQGLATYSFKAANNFCTLKYCEDNEPIRLKAINVSCAASNLGLGLSAVLISSLSEWGFKYLFYLAGFLLFLSAIFLMLTYPKKIKTVESADAPSQAEAKVEPVKPEENNRNIIVLVLTCLFLAGIILSQLGATYSLYIRELFPTWGVKGFSLLFLINTLVVVFFQTPVVNYFKHYDKIIMIGVGVLLTGLGMFTLVFSVFFSLAIFSIVLFTFGEMVCIPLAQLACFEYSSRNRKGRNLGLFQSIFALSMIVGPAFGGYIYYHLGGKILWYMSGMIGLLCLIICLWFQYSKKTQDASF